MSRTYTDNAMNRRLGRVGQPIGTMPHSSSASDANVYVDNAYNRRAGRAGQQRGTAVIPSSARGTNTPSPARGNSTPSPRPNNPPVENERSSTISTTKTYVDNAQNRRLHRVGLPHGTAVSSVTHRHSPNTASWNINDSSSRPTEVSRHRDSSTSTVKANEHNIRGDLSNCTSDTLQPYAHTPVGVIRKPTSASKSEKRSSGRVSSTVVTDRKQGNASPVLYERNDSYTDSVTRVKTKQCTRGNREPENHPESSVNYGQAYGTSRENDHLQKHTSSLSFSELKSDVKASQDKTKTEKRYVDSYYNRKHGRVGLLHGEAVISSKDDANVNFAKAKSDNDGDVIYKRPTSSVEIAVYTDNPQNRKLKRVGMPHGTMVYSQKTNDITARVYADTTLNRKLGRVGKPLGSMPRKSNVTCKIPIILEKLRTNQISEPAYDDGMPDDMYESKDPSKTALRQAICHHNRIRAERSWQRNTKEPPKTEMSILEDYNGKKISFDELKLHARIGRGGFGEVYFAKWHETVVAVKKLRTEKFTDKNIVTFAEEVKKFCELNHPNIVKFIGACTDMPDMCIVMEYMQYSLYDAIHLHKLNFADEDILSIAQQVCKGIKYLHERRIAHCDIKTANILLDFVENHICEAKITDFGLSMMSGEFGSHRGTLRYSAPEILRGDVLCLRDMMHTDVYSLGLVLFEIIFFEEPYHDFTAVQIRQQVGEHGVTPEISKDVMVDDDVLDIIHKTWKFEPHLRPKAREISDIMNRTVNIFIENEY